LFSTLVSKDFTVSLFSSQLFTHFLDYYPKLALASLLFSSLLFALIVHFNLDTDKKSCSSDAVWSWCRYILPPPTAESVGNAFKFFGSVYGSELGVFAPIALLKWISAVAGAALGFLYYLGGKALDKIGQHFLDIASSGKSVELVIYTPKYLPIFGWWRYKAV
jgi:hypothetical protein